FDQRRFHIEQGLANDGGHCRFQWDLRRSNHGIPSYPLSIRCCATPFSGYHRLMESASFDDLRIGTLPRTLREIAVERLRGAIIAGRFASGARLVERTLCDQLGVSRSVVREA